ncbi:unnamed protein product, partial [Effrenium voratum]
LRHGKLGPDAPVLVFWDLDNLKPSPSVSLRSCILALGMRMNSTNTKVHIFANTHTWSRLYVAKADGSSPESGEAVDWPEGNLSQIHPDALFGPGSLLCAMRSRTGRRPEPSDLSLSGWAQSAGLLLQERGAEAVLFHLRRFLALHAATFTAVPSTFQAADRALSQSLRREVEAHRRSRGTVVVVSGDADFAHGLDFARRQGWRTALGCAPNRLPIHPGNHWANQPGVVAAEWTPEFVKVFYIPEAELEKAGLEGAGAPQPDDWDQYIMSYLPFKKSEDLESGTCPNPDKVLWPQQLVFQTSFCGDWAGKTWGNSGSCVNVVGPTMDRCDAVDPLAPDTKPESFEHDCCSMYVYDENQEFKSDEHFHWTAYWNFTYIKASFQY